MNKTLEFSQEELDILEKNLKKSHISHYALIDARNPSSNLQKFYVKYLKNNYHAKMNYLENISAKFSLDAFLPNTKTILACLYPYLHTDSKKIHQKGYYKIAKYAHGKNYHNVIKTELKKILETFSLNTHRIIIDSTPFPERYYARKAKLGFIGKNGMLIHPKDGSYLFLTFVLFQQKISNKDMINNTSQQIENDFDTTKQDIEHFCKNCDLCVRACPTQAILKDGIIDSNKCISYHTIESHKVEPESTSKNISSKKHRWIFGCDVCQIVCPYNKSSLITTQEKFAPLEILDKITRRSNTLLKEKIKTSNLWGTALKRIGIKGIQKNQSYVNSL